MTDDPSQTTQPSETEASEAEIEVGAQEMQPLWLREVRGFIAVIFIFGGILLYMSHFPHQSAWAYWAVFALLAILAVPIHGRSLGETLKGLWDTVSSISG